MRRLLIALSGARPEILEQCPTERGKYEGIGGAVLTTSVLAGLSMWFALSSALGLNPVVAVPVALAWGLAIMSLDRWLVATIPPDGARRFRLALPRLAMAVLLGFVISTPLVLQIFKSEIEAEMVEIKQRRAAEFLSRQSGGDIGQEVARWRKSVDGLQKVIATNGDVPLDPAADPRVRALEKELKKQRDLEKKYYDEWQCQLYGGDGCTRAGQGPLADSSERAYRKARQQVQDTQGQIDGRKKELVSTSAAARQTRVQQARADLPEARRQLESSQKRQRDLQAAFDAENRAANGLLIRLEALFGISGHNLALTAAHILLFLLFLLLECLPLLVKLMQRPGNYDEILRMEARRELRRARQGRRGTGLFADQPAGGGPAPGSGPGNGNGSGVRPLWEQGPEQPRFAEAGRPSDSGTRPYDANPYDANPDDPGPYEPGPYEPGGPFPMGPADPGGGRTTSPEDAAIREAVDTRITLRPDPPPPGLTERSLYDDDDEL